MNDTQDVVATLREYHTRGWALVRLHHVVDGVCTCVKGATCRSAGKHPNVGKGWETRAVPSWPDIQAWLDEDPSANWGVRTGAPSGVFVLDWDPANATGPVDLSVLPPPHTRTGGGGLHWFFQMPADFEPNNSSGRLPAGFDIRGTGGQVVVPPSVSAKGPYIALPGVELGAYAPAEQLLSLIRPEPRAERVAGPAPVVENAGYVAAAVGGVLRELAELPEGRRNADGWRLARRIRELCAGGGVDAEVYRGHYLEALGRAGLDAGEATELWDVKSVVKDVEPVGPVQRAVTLPGALPPLVMPPFPAAGTPPTPGFDPVDALLAELLDEEGLAAVPPPRWLIQGFLVRDSLARLNGRPGSLKSFAVLDMGMSVAAGQDWHGRKVEQGDVWCLLGEGASGTEWRARAWRQAHGAERVERMRYLPRPVQAAGPEWGVLVEAARRRAPALIIIDTQSRHTVGIKENDNTDMGIFVERAEELRRATGACVLLVHHAGQAGREGGRGAEVVYGALTTEMVMLRPDGSNSATLKTIKQKNAPELEQAFVARQVPLMRVDPVHGITTPTGETSLVLDTVDAQASAPAVDPAGLVAGATAQLLGLFMGDGPFARGDGGTKGEARQQFKAHKYGADKTFYRAWGTLVELKALGRVIGSASYRHVPAEDRPGLVPAGNGEWVISG